MTKGKNTLSAGQYKQPEKDISGTRSLSTNQVLQRIHVAVGEINERLFSVNVISIDPTVDLEGKKSRHRECIVTCHTVPRGDDVFSCFINSY